MVSKFQSEMVSTTSRSTGSKITLHEQKRKDPNAGVFIDTSGHVSETLHLDWSWIYAIFDNDDFSTIPHDQPTYARIQSSHLHHITSQHPFMPYIDHVKWALDNANHNELTFDNHVHTPSAYFHPNFFSRDYYLRPPK